MCLFYGDYMRLKKQEKLKIYMYASNVCIKKIKVPFGTNIFNETYVINVWFKKYVFGSNHVKIVVRPKLMKKNLDKEVHVEIEYERGTEV